MSSSSENNTEAKKTDSISFNNFNIRDDTVLVSTAAESKADQQNATTTTHSSQKSQPAPTQLTSEVLSTSSAEQLEILLKNKNTNDNSPSTTSTTVLGCGNMTDNYYSSIFSTLSAQLARTPPQAAANKQKQKSFSSSSIQQQQCMPAVSNSNNKSSKSTVPTQSPATAAVSSLASDSPANSETPTMRLGGYVKNSSLNSIQLSRSDRLLSQIPLMNSMVRYQLQKLLKVREITRKKYPQSADLLKRPVAVLTAYSIKRIPTNGSSKSLQGKGPSSKVYHKLPGKVFYGDYLPVVCEYLSAVIHLNKFYCPGTHRPCLEYEGTLISPFDLLHKVGLSYTVNWQAIFRVGDGQSVKLLFDNNELDFRNHDLFCSGQCHRRSSGLHRPPVNPLLGRSVSSRFLA